MSYYYDLFRASTVDPVAALDALLETARDFEPITEQSEPLEIVTQVHIQYSVQRYLCNSQIQPLEIDTQLHKRELYTVHRYLCISQIELLEIVTQVHNRVCYTVHRNLCTSQIDSLAKVT